jgi:hypothetical protein
VSSSQPYGENLSQKAANVNPRGGKRPQKGVKIKNIKVVAFYAALCKQNVIFPQDVVLAKDGRVHILNESLHKIFCIIV